jgi:SagB-type dehydrogenase family enzyme|tara:strand:+ start:201 stop:860 length:660 start_codon:yes stop_codon:yes gene_type:complete
MDVFECIRTRRSIRKYKDQPVEWDKIVSVLEAGKFAPSAGNLQNFKFIVVKDEAIRKKMADAAHNQTWMEIAPVHIIICSDPSKSKRFYGARGERLYSIQDCAAVAENMLLVAHSLGLGACWVGSFDEDKIRKVQNLPETIQVHSIITIGYADETPQMPPKYRIEHVVFLDRWGGRKHIPFSSMGWWSTRWEKYAKDAAKGVKKGVEKIRQKVKEKRSS